MDPVNLSAEDTATSRRHSRHPSYHRALPRRSTKGPLDVDDPVAATSAAPSSPQHTSSPEPARPKTVQSPSPSPPPQDLSFLLQPSIYHTLPPPFQPTPASSPPSQRPDEAYRNADYFAAASMSAQRLTQPPAPPPKEIFELIHTRLRSLVKLKYLNIASAESEAFGDVNAAFYREEATGSCFVPWELRVLIVRLLGLKASDVRARQNALAGLYELAKDARAEYRKCRSGKEEEIWKKRLADVGVMVGNVLVEEGDYQAALRQVQGLKGQLDGQDWAARMLLIHAKCGNLDAATHLLFETEVLNANRTQFLQSIVAICRNDFEKADAHLLELGNDEASTENNRALTQLYQGNVAACIDILESSNGTGYLSRESIFNLATCYELKADWGARQRKEALVEMVNRDTRGRREAFHPADFKL